MVRVFLAKKGKGKAQPKGQERNRERKLGRDGLILLGGDPGKFCEEHKRWGHDVSTCYIRNGYPAGH